MTLPVLLIRWAAAVCDWSSQLSDRVLHLIPFLKVGGTYQRTGKVGVDMFKQRFKRAGQKILML